MKKYLPLTLFVLAFTLVLAGQVGFQTLFATQTSKNESKTQKYEDHLLKAKLVSFDNKIIEPSKLKAPVIIYNFWASWCNPCLEEMPSMVELKKLFKDDELQIIAFNTDETDQSKNISKIIKKMNIKSELNIVPDVNTKIADGLGLTAIPVTIVFNRGKVVLVSNGPMDFMSKENIENMKKWVKN